jgi:2-polyprenyl-3-methyl-5-hydroxy-6-metoxy-1,4-benzoquinol methylase
MKQHSTALQTEQYFEKQYCNSYGSPKNIKFVIYDNEMWQLCLKHIKESDLVADYGFGGGTLLHNVAQLSKAKLFGIEQAEPAILQSKTLIPKLNAVKGNIIETPLKSSCIDFIFSTMVIEHVDDKNFAEEVYRTLKPGGYFFVTSVIKAKHAWYFYKNASGETVLEPTHLKEYKSIQELEALLKPLGFTIVKSSAPRIRYPLLDPFFKLLAKCTGIKNLLEWKPIEFIRLSTQIPIPGYFAAEILAKKTH